jgi:hypothetical protein
MNINRYGRTYRNLKSNKNSFRFEFEFIKKIRRMNLSDRIGKKKIEQPGTRSTRDGGTYGSRRRRDPHTVDPQHHVTRNRQEKTPIADTKFKSPVRLKHTTTSFGGKDRPKAEGDFKGLPRLHAEHGSLLRWEVLLTLQDEHRYFFLFYFFKVLVMYSTPVFDFSDIINKKAQS